mmetsp:Transcript_33301/g.106132  ORF Transcript_33301/g.106132 Transcript_33301/m.106132 type:complete len:220 (+) Transcript_33301:43-702(+)
MPSDESQFQGWPSSLAHHRDQVEASERLQFDSKVWLNDEHWPDDTSGAESLVWLASPSGQSTSLAVGTKGYSLAPWPSFPERAEVPSWQPALFRSDATTTPTTTTIPLSVAAALAPLPVGKAAEAEAKVGLMMDIPKRSMRAPLRFLPCAHLRCSRMRNMRAPRWVPRAQGYRRLEVPGLRRSLSADSCLTCFGCRSRARGASSPGVSLHQPLCVTACS